MCQKLFLFAVSIFFPILGSATCFELAERNSLAGTVNNAIEPAAQSEVSADSASVLTPEESKAFELAVRALRSAPPDLAEAMKKSLLALLRDPYSMKKMDALGILGAMGAPQPEIEAAVAESVALALSYVPVRKPFAQLTYERQNLFIVEKSGNTSHLSSFPEKWGLGKYQNLLARLFDQFHPEEYKNRGVESGDWENRFFSSALHGLPQIAARVGLDKESSAILTVMLTHEDSKGFLRAALALGRDDLLWTGGLFQLANFFSNPYLSFDSNEFWSAIETLKMVQNPKMRANMANLFMDLADEIMSPEFEAKLNQYLDTIPFHRVPREPDKIYPDLLKYTLRGLTSAGETFAFQNESVLVFAVHSRSRNPKLRQKIRQVIDFTVARKFSVKEEEKIAAYLVTDDHDRLIRLAQTNVTRRKKANAAMSYIAIGNIAKAGELFASYFDPNLGKTEDVFRSLLSVAQLKGNASELANELKTRVDGRFYPLLNKTLIEVQKAEYKSFRRQSSVELLVAQSWFQQFHSQNMQTRTPAEIQYRAAGAAAQGDHLFAGFQFAYAAYALYLESHPKP